MRVWVFWLETKSALRFRPVLPALIFHQLTTINYLDKLKN